MRNTKLSSGQILLRAVAGAALVAVCCINLPTCMAPFGYQRDVENKTGDFDIDVDLEGGCLPDVEPERPVHRITIYKIKKDEQVAAEAICTEDRDMIELFEYRGEDGCSLRLVDSGDGGEPDAGDASAGDAGPEDAGPGDAGIWADLCYCAVGEHWLVEDGDETAFCRGNFLIVAETVDGSSATVEYEQEFEDPEEDHEEQDNQGSCSCRAVGS